MKKNNFKKVMPNGRQGFTIGLLASVVLTALSSSRNKSNIAKTLIHP